MAQQEIRSIVLIGTGNLAYHLAGIAKASGAPVIQILGKSPEKAGRLAEPFQIPYIINPDFLRKDADLYILAVGDAEIKPAASKLGLSDQLIIHTSGFTPMEALSGSSTNYGVAWPVQTMTAGKPVNYHNIPWFVEGSNETVTGRISAWLNKVSQQLILADSATRQKAHLAAVVASNLTNHLYRISAAILEKNGLSFDILSGLIRETAEKALTQSPSGAQTGPASRNDTGVVSKHLEMLADNPEFREIYRLISENILHLYKK